MTSIDAISFKTISILSLFLLVQTKNHFPAAMTPHTVEEKDGVSVTTVTATAHLDLPAHPKQPTYDQLNPKSSPTEFLGPLGTLGVTVTTPIFVYLLYFGCNETTGCPPGWNSSTRSFNIQYSDIEAMFEKLFDLKAFIVYLGWYAYIVACWALIPGDWVEGTLIRDGTKKLYKVNAFSTLLLTTGLLVPVVATSSGQESLSWMYNHWLGLANAAVCMAIFQAVWVYAWSFHSRELLAKGGNSGVFVYDASSVTVNLFYFTLADESSCRSS